MNEQSRFDQKAFFLNKAKWPRYPMLPVIKRTILKDRYDVGVIFAEDSKDGEITIYRANIFAPRNEIRRAPILKFKSIDEMFDSGWEID